MPRYNIVAKDTDLAQHKIGAGQAGACASGEDADIAHSLYGYELEDSDVSRINVEFGRCPLFLGFASRRIALGSI